MQNDDWASKAVLLHQIIHSDESSSVCKAFEFLNESTRGGGTSRTFKELKQSDQLPSRESEAGSVQQLHQRTRVLHRAAYRSLELLEESQNFVVI